jgi:hypothetical protein
MHRAEVDHVGREGDDHIDWNALASTLLLLLDGSSHRPRVLSIGGLANAHPNLRRVAGVSIIANPCGLGVGGQKTVDAVRRFLAEAGIPELGFATTREVPSSYPLCPSEGWALVVASADVKTLQTQVDRLEDEIYAAFHEDAAVRGASSFSPWTLLGPATVLDSSALISPIQARPVISNVDHVNGAGAAAAEFEVTRAEAELLAQHWVTSIINIEYEFVVLGQSGSSTIRKGPYAHSRLYHLLDARLIESHRLESMFAEERARAGLEPPVQDHAERK